MTAPNEKIVSSEDELLILVDASDAETGFLSKGQCHDGEGVLHRAFSVFLFNEHGELLLQQRSGDKRLWPLYWSNSCCSHPRKGESMAVATARRLQDELNVSADLQFVYKFSYRAEYGEAGSENELCWVYLGKVHGDIGANPTEIEALRYITPDTLDQELQQHEERFTPWFKMEWHCLNQEHAKMLAEFTTNPNISPDAP